MSPRLPVAYCTTHTDLVLGGVVEEVGKVGVGLHHAKHEELVEAKLQDGRADLMNGMGYRPSHVPRTYMIADTLGEVDGGVDRHASYELHRKNPDRPV